MAAKRQHRPIDGQAFDDDLSDNDVGRERLCVVTRVAQEPDALIRFARSPDGDLVPDLDRRLPGRGAWVTCDRKTLEKAIKTKAFARSFKADARAAADLPERVDGMLLRRLTATLSLANKAGLAIAGFQQVDSALEKGQVAAVLHGHDAAADGRGKLDRKFRAIQRDRGLKAPIADVLTISEMSLAMGRPSVVHAALIPGELTDRFLREAERILRYRASPATFEQVFSENAPDEPTQFEG